MSPKKKHDKIGYSNLFTNTVCIVRIIIGLAIGRYEMVAVAFLDLSEAIDTVDIEMLTTTLMNLSHWPCTPVAEVQ